MNSIRVLLYKAFARYLRNRTALALTFIVPIAMIYIFGQVFGLNREEAGPRGIPLAIVNASDHPAAKKLVAALEAEAAFRIVTQFSNPDHSTRPLREDDVRPMIRNRDLRFGLIIPTDLVPKNGLGLHLKILANPVNEIETQTVNGILQKAIFFNVPELLGESLQGRAKRVVGQDGIDVIGHLGNLIIISVAAAAACTALGMLIASVSDTPESAAGLATFLVLTMSAIGGAWFPVSFMPPFMQQFAKFTLTYWAMEGFSEVLWASKTFLEILPTVGILLAITGGMMAVAIRQFNRGNLFD